MKKLKIGDNVKIILGNDKGKMGIIKSLLHKKGKAIVDGINIKIKHIKPSKNKAGNIVKFYAALDISNMMLSDQNCIVSKVGFIICDGKKFRICKKTKNLILSSEK
jgi:large subunit ribosomal protein L24